MWYLVYIVLYALVLLITAYSMLGIGERCVIDRQRWRSIIYATLLGGVALGTLPSQLIWLPSPIFVLRAVITLTLSTFLWITNQRIKRMISKEVQQPTYRQIVQVCALQLTCALLLGGVIMTVLSLLQLT